MLSAKSPDTSHYINLTIRRGDNECFHLGRMLFRVMLLACAGNSQLSKCFRRMSPSKHRPRFAKHSLSLFLNSLNRAFFAKVSLSDLLTSLRRRFLAKSTLIAKHEIAQFRKLHAQSRTSDASNIETLVPKRFQFGKPVLLTGGQQFRKKHQFQDFKDERLFTVLVPSILQFGIRVNIASKLSEVVMPALKQVNSTTNVELVRNGASNAVNTRCVGYVTRKHANCLSLAPCVSCCQGGKATTFSAWEATPSLDNLYYTILSEVTKSGNKI